VLYFQRTLTQLGYQPEQADVFFANGLDGVATIRYLNPAQQERFKSAQIPYLRGAATRITWQRWWQQAPQSQPIFLYFTGHGIRNEHNVDNNALLLWHDQTLSVQAFGRQLDALPPDQLVVVMMAQCFAGSFANLIYRAGIPAQGVAPQPRCGFFATVSTRPSVGCTPAVNEADYRDYSSSFFAGLSGRDRLGQSVSSADYNHDGRISYAEAHAFAKVDGETTDWPISTLEAWLQREVSEQEIQHILQQSINTLLKSARSEQRYVVGVLSQRFRLNPQQSWQANWQTLNPRKNLWQQVRALMQPTSKVTQSFSEEDQAFLMRLRMELITVGAERLVRSQAKKSQMAVLNQLIACEAGSWQLPSGQQAREKRAFVKIKQ
jgi:hypothetical protein